MERIHIREPSPRSDVAQCVSDSGDSSNQPCHPHSLRGKSKAYDENSNAADLEYLPSATSTYRAHDGNVFIVRACEQIRNQSDDHQQRAGKANRCGATVSTVYWTTGNVDGVFATQRLQHLKVKAERSVHAEERKESDVLEHSLARLEMLFGSLKQQQVV